MVEKLLGDVSHFAIPICAIAAVLIATMRYGVPALLAAFLATKGRRASIRSTKNGIEIDTDVPAPDVLSSQVWIASVGTVEAHLNALPDKHPETADLTDAVENVVFGAIEAGRK